MESLKELRKSCESRRIPIISLATEKFLWKLLRKHKPKICLEIWGAVGYSSIYIGWMINTRGGKITSFEISYPAYQEGLQNGKEAHCHNIISYPYDVLYAPIKKLVQAPADFIFIDGQKSQYGEYLEIVEKFRSPHTVIIIDDVIQYHNKLSSLYWYLQKKQINCVRTPKGGSFGWENHTGDLRNRKHKWNEVISDFENSRVYEILQLEPDDGVMIINSELRS